MRWLLLLIGLTACSRVEMPNDCLIDAINFNQALQSKARLTKGQVWNDLLVVKFVHEGEIVGHVYSVFEWNGQLWAWDQEGSRLIESPRDSAYKIGKELKPGAIHSYWIREQTK